MKYTLKSGEEKEYGEMTIKEKEEVERESIKGFIIAGAVLGGMHFLDKI